MISIIDYDAGNIMSVQKACAYLGHDYVLTRDREKILNSDHVILPGVGAFGDAMERLERYGMDETLKEVKKRGIPLLGICLGLQLFFDESEETPGVKGLGLLKGRILRIPDQAEDPSVVTATTEYGTRIDASVEKENLFACQFHPEKSSSWGLKILENFFTVH